MHARRLHFTAVLMDLIASLLAWAVQSSLRISGNYRPEVSAKMAVVTATTKSAAARLRPKS